MSAAGVREWVGIDCTSLRALEFNARVKLSGRIKEMITMPDRTQIRDTIGPVILQAEISLPPSRPFCLRPLRWPASMFRSSIELAEFNEMRLCCPRLRHQEPLALLREQVGNFQHSANISDTGFDSGRREALGQTVASEIIERAAINGVSFGVRCSSLPRGHQVTHLPPRVVGALR